MFDDEDEFPDPRPSRLSVLLQLGAFVAVMAVAGVVTWRMLSPQSAEATPGVPESLRVATAEAKRLPEYAELRRFANRQLTQAEIARAISLTQHPNLKIRLEALNRLSTVRDTSPLRSEAMDAAVLALQDDSEYVRAAALAALSGMRAREREADVRRMLASADPGTRTNAKRALEQMGLPAE